MSNSSSPPKKGAQVELKGLVAKPELNGCKGVVISCLDSETGRCGIRLDDGTGINAKLSNITVLTPELVLERALEKLTEKGGTEKEAEDDDEDATPVEEYLKELMAVGDARYAIGHYSQAGSIFYRAYYATMHMGPSINCPESFPVMHKMLQAWSKSDDEHSLKFGHGMAQQTLMMPGAPPYIRSDMKDIEKAMKRKGIPVQDLMAQLNSFKI